MLAGATGNHNQTTMRRGGGSWRGGWQYAGNKMGGLQFHLFERHSWLGVQKKKKKEECSAVKQPSSRIRVSKLQPVGQLTPVTCFHTANKQECILHFKWLGKINIINFHDTSKLF